MEVKMLNSTDFYMLAIVALLPLTASLLVFQTNPYQALVIRGILGAMSALIYALFGAADVALTEALVGTMLSITLYAIAVRSSMSMRLGILAQDSLPDPVPDFAPDSTNLADAVSPDLEPPEKPSCFSYVPIISVVQNCLKPYHLRLEIVPYPTVAELQKALQTKAVQSICLPPSAAVEPRNSGTDYEIQTRLRRLHEILQPGVLPTIVTLMDHHSPDYSPNSAENSSPPSTPNPVEA
jgi:putative multicomponent Na+:H+ antiporter subunit B